MAPDNGSDNILSLALVKTLYPLRVAMDVRVTEPSTPRVGSLPVEASVMRKIGINIQRLLGGLGSNR
jgi:hypothetical protein